MPQKVPPTIAAVTRLFPPRLRQWIGPIAALALFSVIAAIIVASTGLLAFPASLPDPQGMESLVHSSFQRSVDQHSDDIREPADFGAAWRIQLGAAHFARSCAACHGEPRRGQNPIALSMRPRPQYLPAVVDQYTPSQLFWIVKHGVKFAGMPAWPAQARDDEVWSVVAFLTHIDELGGPQYATLAYGGEAGNRDEAYTRHRYVENNSQEPPRDDYSYTWPAAALRQAGGDTGCEGCHGSDGKGHTGGAAPNLAIQKPQYLEAALRSFADGLRPSGIMQNVAASMTAKDMKDAAEYFSGKPGGTGRNLAFPERLTEKGRTIAVDGIPSRRVAACASCHGVEGASKIGFPVIAGQNFVFLQQQMRLYRAGNRGRTQGYDPMARESHTLTDAEIDAVSAYYASLDPGASPAAAIAAVPTTTVASRE